MSEPRRDDEPTMEEILASIRKIISEDDPETSPRAEDASGSGDDEDSEPMELTQMVSEDGSVVDLRAEPRASLVALTEDGDEDSDEETEDVLDDRGTAADQAAVVEPLVPEGTRVHAEMVDEDLLDDDGDVELDVREGDVDQAEIAPEPEAEPEPEAPTVPRQKLDGLVSPDVAAAAAAAMARLKDSLAAGTPVGGGKTMEDLVSDAMMPHLKAWLDENLPQLVERVVREEIEKIVKGSGPR